MKKKLAANDALSLSINDKDDLEVNLGDKDLKGLDNLRLPEERNSQRYVTESVF